MDFTILVKLARHVGQPGTFATGDLNDDGQVDFADLVLLARNYGHALSVATIATGANLPDVSAATASDLSMSHGRAKHSRAHLVGRRNPVS